VIRRKWVVNASPVIVLANIGRLSFQEGLCTEMVIPTAVAQEIRAGPQKDAAQRWLESHAQTAVRHLEGV
jgi:predicted nucleic acid-binding protein